MTPCETLFQVYSRVEQEANDWVYDRVWNRVHKDVYNLVYVPVYSGLSTGGVVRRAVMSELDKGAGRDPLSDPLSD